MKMKNKLIDIHNRLYEYLDWYCFVNSDEVYCAICDFIENEDWSLYYSDCASAYNLWNEYIKDRKLELE